MESKEEERTSSNKKRDPPCLTELFQNQKEKKKKQYDTNINHIHLMEIIMQETADLYVMILVQTDLRKEWLILHFSTEEEW